MSCDSIVAICLDTLFYITFIDTIYISHMIKKKFVKNGLVNTNLDTLCYLSAGLMQVKPFMLLYLLYSIAKVGIWH